MMTYCRNIPTLLKCYANSPMRSLHTKGYVTETSFGTLYHHRTLAAVHVINQKREGAFVVVINRDRRYLNLSPLVRSGHPIFYTTSLFGYSSTFPMHAYLDMIEDYRKRIERERNNVATSRREYTGNLYLENMHRLENELEAFLNFIGKDVIMTHFLKQAVGNHNGS